MPCNCRCVEDHNSQFGNYTTGGVGYGYRITPAWRTSVSYGKAFKAPTFNPLYFPIFGDPNLSPEKSDNVEASLKYGNQKLNAGVTIFENKIRNLIEFSGMQHQAAPLLASAQLMWEKLKFRE